FIFNSPLRPARTAKGGAVPRHHRRSRVGRAMSVARKVGPGASPSANARGIKAGTTPQPRGWHVRPFRRAGRRRGIRGRWLAALRLPRGERPRLAGRGVAGEEALLPAVVLLRAGNGRAEKARARDRARVARRIAGEAEDCLPPVAGTGSRCEGPR